MSISKEKKWHQEYRKNRDASWKGKLVRFLVQWLPKQSDYVKWSVANLIRFIDRLPWYLGIGLLYRVTGKLEWWRHENKVRRWIYTRICSHTQLLDNYIVINAEIAAHQGELVFNGNTRGLQIEKLIGFSEDDMDFYWVTQNIETGIVHHTAVGGFIPFKPIMKGTYERYVYTAMLEEFDEKWADPKIQKKIEAFKEKQRKLYLKIFKRKSRR